MGRIEAFDRVLKTTQKPYLNKAPALPFVKWAGGKRALIPDIAKQFPSEINHYWEPFIGGGAVFFTFSDRINRATLSDLNEELVLTYHVVKFHVEDLIDELAKHEKKHHSNEKHYLNVRKREPREPIDIAARFIYLNKTCFNGLYRVNKQGKFNVPKGNYKNPAICNAQGLRDASKALSKATIRLGDFENVVNPTDADFVYCDPPYDDCFTEYQAGGFSSDDQERLRDRVLEWSYRGAKVLVSNSNTELINKLYANPQFTHTHAEAPRYISSKASTRNPVKELLISTYA